MGRVVVVGSINVDLVAGVPHLPQPGETVLATAYARHDGGKGANAAVAAARAGARVAMVGAVGTDADGESQLRTLESEGIGVDGVLRTDGPTGTAFIAVDAAGANQIVVASGANATLTPDGVTDAVRASGAGAGDVLLVSLEVPLEAGVAAARAAREQGMTVVVNPAPVRELPDELLAGVLCTPNRGELARLSGTDDLEEGAARLLARGAAAVVVTLGGDGCAAWDASGHVAFDVEPAEVVDTTGAGDCFNGVLAAALAEGDATREAVRRANAAAGRSVSAPGARGGCAP